MTSMVNSKEQGVSLQRLSVTRLYKWFPILTQLEKAKYAAQVFSKKKWDDCGYWQVQRIVIETFDFGDFMFPVYPGWQQVREHPPREEIFVVKGAHGGTLRYKAEEAYLIAIKLESQEN